MNTHRRSRRILSGFSLIELLTVLAIIGILTAIALPAYNKYVVRARTTLAQTCLEEYAQHMERFFTTNMRYPNNIDGINLMCANDLEGYYTFTTADLTNRAFTLVATPIGTQAESSVETCGTMQLTQTGRRTASKGESCKNFHQS
ncbi:MAG: prepilin-type N-terminal cleavage/methylation domain-containing protein [Rhodocyclaceae bacterium]|nr:prepilin-type N-terminal cleavage/methylation domain-containing protein [Rhodocyclaceae bacterium]